MPDTTPPTEVWPVQSRDQLLKLLEGINAKLEQEKKTPEKMFRWFKHPITRVGVDTNEERQPLKWFLSYQQLPLIFADNRYINDLKNQIRYVIDLVLKPSFGKAIHIPDDGRIQLHFTTRGLQSWSGWLDDTGQSPQRLKSLQNCIKEWNIALSNSDSLECKIFDFEPWSMDREEIEIDEKGNVVDLNQDRLEKQELGIEPDTTGRRRVFGNIADPEPSTFCYNLRNLDEFEKGESPSLDVTCDYYQRKGLKDYQGPRIYPDKPVHGHEEDRSSIHLHRMVEGTTPWRRLIKLEGLADSGLSEEAVYELFDERVRDNFALHLKCRQMQGSQDIIFNDALIGRCFHITYFEKISLPDDYHSLWRSGKLFDADRPPSYERDDYVDGLRHSSITIGIAFSENGLARLYLQPFYSILVLSPSNLENGSFEDILKEPTGIQAQLKCIIVALKTAVSRWVELNEYMDGLLSKDFMKPMEYSMLLFDTENFAQSRKYFWAIAALTDFENSISDNIRQWNAYREERIQPLLNMDNLADRLDAACVYPPKGKYNAYPKAQERRPENRQSEQKEFRDQVAKAQREAHTLEELHAEFTRKLETVKSLRDGLFNASALLESRTSTKLGENVKYLTYVSIFYLPLGFCAALWAIPNILDRTTKIPFIVTAILVGFLTYLIVFNLDFMANQISSRYNPKRARVIKQMQRDTGLWQGKGTRFEEFKPTGTDVPTEWWIPVYWIRSFFVRGGEAGRRGVDGGVERGADFGDAASNDATSNDTTSGDAASRETGSSNDERRTSKGLTWFRKAGRNSEAHHDIEQPEAALRLQ